ncbi:MAG: porin [Hyphomonadaceae bacterium]|nr:porin [Hyphomonadaceae bacterium]
MRNWIIGAAAVLALAVPGVAAAQTGYAGVVYGNADAGAGDDEDFYGVEGAVAFSGSGSIVFEVDASYTDADEGDETYGIVGHVYARNDDHLFGGFIGISDSDDSETYVVGLEANKYFANWTLAGAVAYGDNEDADADGYGVNVEGRFFIHDNFRIDASVGYASIDGGAGDDDDATRLGLGGEYQFASVPISVTAGYSNTDFDNGDIDVWSIGLRYNWGGTLRDRDRSGASQASLVSLPGLTS